MNELSAHLFYFQKGCDGSNDEQKTCVERYGVRCEGYKNGPKTGGPCMGTTRLHSCKFTHGYVWHDLNCGTQPLTYNPNPSHALKHAYRRDTLGEKGYVQKESGVWDPMIVYIFMGTTWSFVI